MEDVLGAAVKKKRKPGAQMPKDIGGDEADDSDSRGEVTESTWMKNQLQSAMAIQTDPSSPKKAVEGSQTLDGHV